jgi:hypothetical protein
MTVPKKLKEALDIYDDKKDDKYKRKAYIDDIVLIEVGVDIKHLINAFQLEKKDKYKKLLSQIEAKNKKENIDKLKLNKEPYKIFTLKYYLKYYDFGYDKYKKLHIEEQEELYKYNTNINEYKYYSTTDGGNRIKYNMKYLDLIDDTYKTIKDVVNRIKKLEENKTKK